MELSEVVKDMIKKQPYHSKLDVTAHFVAILQTQADNRGLSLISLPSRCVSKYQVHELCTTDEQTAQPGAPVQRAAYLGFMEIEEGGVILAGDEVYYNDELIGHVAGFEEGHMPNHLNFVIRTDNFIHGADRGMELNGILRFHKA